MGSVETGYAILATSLNCHSYQVNIANIFASYTWRGTTVGVAFTATQSK